MDPKEALRLTNEAIKSGNMTDALTHLFAYYHWRLRGGFAPCNTSDELAATYAIAITDTVSERE